jgi:DNA-binding FadR family transcriptional regulator
MDSWPPHRVLADAIVAGDADAAVAAIAAILDAVEGEVRRIIGAGAA